MPEPTILVALARQDARRDELATWAPTLLVLAGIALVLALLAPQGTGIDFAVFHRAGARWLRGDDLYRISEWFPFKYAPIAAAFFALLSPWPQRLAWAAMNAISILALWRVMRWTVGRLGVAPGFAAQALVLAVAAPWYGHLLWLGQVDGLVLWLLVDSEEQAARRPVGSGCVWALACLVKPPCLVLLLPAALLREWRRVGGLALGGVAFLALGALRYGVTGGWAQLEGWRSLLGGSTSVWVCSEWNQSVFALVCTYFTRLGEPSYYPAVAVLGASIVLLGTTAAVAVRRADEARGRFALFAFALYLSAVLSPLGWNTNLVAALPLTWALAATATVAASGTHRRAAWGIAAVVALLNCIDLILLPLHLWDDTAKTLLWARQYGIAGLLLAAAAMTGLSVTAVRSPEGGVPELELRPGPSPATG